MSQSSPDAQHDNTASAASTQTISQTNEQQQAPDTPPSTPDDGNGTTGTPPPTTSAGNLLGNDGGSQVQAQTAAPPVPEAYADFTVPDGFEAIPGLMDEFKTTARNLKLSQDQAQSLINLQVKANQAQAEGWTRQRQEWRAQLSTDAEYGGERFTHTVDQAKAALTAYDPGDDLRNLLVSSGFEDHPAVLKFLARVGQASQKEGDVHTGRGGARADDKPLMDRLWPGM